MSVFNCRVSGTASIGNRCLSFGQKLKSRGIETRTFLRLLACCVVALINVSVPLRAEAWTLKFLAVGEAWHALRSGRLLQNAATATERLTIARPPVISSYGQGRTSFESIGSKAFDLGMYSAEVFAEGTSCFSQRHIFELRGCAEVRFPDQTGH